ncbi:MAG: 1-acyl-sn-glycerol-3-phosphate acyltransferase [Flavobacteriales bacterium]|jgi:acyl-[acyl-carrier-protein]-phospholipid O-acyltransferase/long-chain-fatty-acid--[acyl-carrier-protein] ligase|nr:1-acyl-sn-glycerol-3-phosphate acyltransferase [Flavobacteriales bacterium]
MLYFFIPIVIYFVVFIVFPYKTLQITLRTIGKVIFNKKRIGYTIPKSGGALLIANHISHLDFILITLATKRKVYFVMYDKIYYHKAVHWLLKRLNMIPIAPTRPGSSDNNLKTFNERCHKIINSGNIVVIYPEGTVSRNGHLLEFKRGMEYIASGITAPIIPLHVYGANGSPFTFSLQKNDFFKFKLSNLRKQIIINVGKPLSNTTSAFQARQKVLELAAESAFYAHSNKYENFTNAIFKQKNNAVLLMNHSAPITAKELKISTIEFAKQLKQIVKQKGVAVVSMEDELKLIQTVLALSYLGKKSILIDPNDFNNYLSDLKNKYSNCITLTDNRSIIDGIDVNTFKLKTSFKSKFIALLPYLIFRITRMKRKSATSFSIGFRNFNNEELIIDQLSLTNINAFTESISNTHNIAQYGLTLNLKNTYSAIGFLTKIALPVMKGLSAIINHDRKSIAIANTLIGEQTQIEALYQNTLQKNWESIKYIITDYDLNKTIVSLLENQNTKIFKATGIEGIVGLLSINTPNYRGKDIAGKVLKQDGNIPSTFGRPVQGVAVKIVDPNDKTKELEANEKGLVLVKGPLVMHPTHNTPFTWVEVNLRGYLNQKGYLQLLVN